MGQIAKIRRTDVEKAGQFFDEAPEVQPEEVTRKEAVRILASKIKAMRRKRYSWAKIAEALATFGITIEPDLLASYHRAACEPSSGATKRARRESAGKAPEATGVASGTVAPAPAAAPGMAKPSEGGHAAGPRAPARSRTETGGGEGSAR